MILSDRDILASIADSKLVITPFRGYDLREQQKARREFSSGLTSSGYDLTLGNRFKMARKKWKVVDPKNVADDVFEDVEPEGNRMVIPANSFILAESVEWFEIPPDLAGFVEGKSSYARIGVIANFTKLEPGWKGKVTIELGNLMPVPVAIYCGEGIAQVSFVRVSSVPILSYADKGGRYQDQTGITLPKV